VYGYAKDVEGEVYLATERSTAPEWISRSGESKLGELVVDDIGLCDGYRLGNGLALLLP